jgi:hypothetical protein
MIYWCQDEQHWTIQSITNIDRIATFGCRKQGLAANSTNGPGNLCDAVWYIQGVRALFVAGADCPLPSSTPTVTPGITIDVLGNPYWFYDFLSGTYSGSSDSVYGVSVYYLEYDSILYWCEPSSQWYLDIFSYGVNIALIPFFGCSGEPSNQVSGPDVSLCDVKFDTLIIFTSECPMGTPSPSVDPGPDVQVIANPNYYGSVSGTYVGSFTDSVYGVSVYYNDESYYMIYWCQPTSQWYITWITDVEAIQYFDCDGFSSSSVVSGPDVSFCDVQWDDFELFTIDCPAIPPSPPAIPGPDVQVISNPEYYGADFSGTFVGSTTDSVYGVSVYYNYEIYYMIYWCEPSSQWYYSWIDSLEAIYYFGCFGWPSVPVANGPGNLCNATWLDDAGNLDTVVFSSQCPTGNPNPSPTGPVSPFDLAVLDYWVVPTSCKGNYVERAEKTPTGGLIFSNGPCFIYQFNAGSQIKWEVVSIFDLNNVIVTGRALFGYANSTVSSTFPCSAGFYSIAFCSPDCPSSYTEATSGLTIDTSIGLFQESTTLIDGAPVWFSCYGSFEYSESSWYSEWNFYSTTRQLLISGYSFSNLICEAEFWDITISCEEWPSQAPSQMPSQVPSLSPSQLPSQVPSQSPSQVPSRSPSRLPSQVPSRWPSGKPSSTPSITPSRAPSSRPSSQPSKHPTPPPSII